MNGLGLEIRRVKGTPYKIVLSNWNIIGIFDRGRYVEKGNMNPEHKSVADRFHASTFVERLASIK